MKREIIGIFFGLALGAGIYSQARLIPPNDPNAAAQQGQSEIIINAGDVEKDIAVWVNDLLVAHVFPKKTEKILVRDGRNVIQVAETNIKRGQWDIGDKKQVVVDSKSNRVTLGLVMRYGRLINVNIQHTIAIATERPRPLLDPDWSVEWPTPRQPAVQPAPTPTPQPPLQQPVVQQPVATPQPRPPSAPSTATGIEGAVNRTAETLVVDLPNGSTLAIISISSSDREMAEFVIEELAYLLVDTKRFRIVDRKSLEAIRAEEDFQASGEVDDKSAVSIGGKLGASIVITGSISGSGSTRRLRAKALDVKTAEIVAMASERF
ncbi:MAG: CsgG/HfaB family protein [Treponema sp.]|jgi:TolB-like protein|nr:CsgG/HfaB family protein [Treponema sp.]